MSAALPPSEADQPSPADELAGSEQPFVAHLIELRDRLLASIYGVIAALIALALYPGPARLMDWVAAPIRAHMPPDAKLIATGVLSPFIVPLKVLAIAALLLALPWIMFQAWRFVAPGLYKHEKRFVLPLILLGSFLAYAGIAFVQMYVLEHMFAFIQGFTSSSVSAMPDVASYVETILNLYLAFAAAFQVPVVVILAVRFGFVSVAQLRQFRGYALLGAAVICAIITPPDALSMLILLGCMMVLYELGIILAGFFALPAGAQTQADADAAVSD